MTQKAMDERNACENRIQPSAASKEYFNIKDRYYLRVKNWKKIFQAKGPNKQAGAATFTSLSFYINCASVGRGMEKEYMCKERQLGLEIIGLGRWGKLVQWELSGIYEGHPTEDS